MNLISYTKNLFIILWNIITFLCPFISENNTQEKETSSFSSFACTFKHFNNIYKYIKELTNKITPKQTNINTAKISVVTNTIIKNKNFVSNRVNVNNRIRNKPIKNANLLYTNKLKDALATQILISKHYFSCIKDKCAYFSVKRLSLPVFV